MDRLTVTGGSERGRSIPLRQIQVIGRLRSNDVTLDDEGLSRRHARIFRSDGGWNVVDLGSRNGVLVNGRRVRRAELHDGDSLQLGGTLLRVELDPVAAPSPAGGAAGGRKAAPGPGAGISVKPDAASRVLVTRRQAGEGRHRLPDWLRTDVSQVGGLYRLLVAAGSLALLAGLGYLAFLMVAG